MGNNRNYTKQNTKYNFSFKNMLKKVKNLLKKLLRSSAYLIIPVNSINTDFVLFTYKNIKINCMRYDIRHLVMRNFENLLKNLFRKAWYCLEIFFKIGYSCDCNCR